MFMDMVELFTRGTHLVAEHDSPSALSQSAALVLDVVSTFPNHGLIAASAAAERVLGAIMVMSPEVQVGPADDIVIFDVCLASGTVLARAADRLRRQGHTGTIVAVAVQALCEDVPASIEGADHLVVIDGSALHHEKSECRDHRLLVAL